MKINKNKSKREQIIERMNDIKNIILLSEEYIEIASMEKTEENDNKINLGNDMNNMNSGKQETGINTDEITYNDKGTATEENLDLNFINEDNDEEIKEKDKDKEKDKEIEKEKDKDKEKENIDMKNEEYKIPEIKREPIDLFENFRKMNEDYFFPGSFYRFHGI